MLPQIYPYEKHKDQMSCGIPADNTRTEPGKRQNSHFEKRGLEAPWPACTAGEELLLTTFLLKGCVKTNNLTWGDRDLPGFCRSTTLLPVQR